MIRFVTLITLFVVLTIGVVAQEPVKPVPSPAPSTSSKPLPEKVSLVTGQEKEYQILILQYDNILKAVRLIEQQMEILRKESVTAAKDKQDTENRLRDFIKSSLTKAGVPPAELDNYQVDLGTGEATRKPKEPAKKEN